MPTPTNIRTYGELYVVPETILALSHVSNSRPSGRVLSGVEPSDTFLLALPAKPDASEETHIMVSQGFSDAFAALGGHFCMNQLYYTREVEKSDVLEPFVNVQPQLDTMNSMHMLTLKDAANEQAQQSSDGVR